jgi:hypothetical protein
LDIWKPKTAFFVRIIEKTNDLANCLFLILHNKLPPFLPVNFLELRGVFNSASEIVGGS